MRRHREAILACGILPHLARPQRGPALLATAIVPLGPLPVFAPLLLPPFADKRRRGRLNLARSASSRTTHILMMVDSRLLGWAPESRPNQCLQPADPEQPAFSRLLPNRTCRRHAKIGANDPKLTLIAGTPTATVGAEPVGPLEMTVARLPLGSEFSGTTDMASVVSLPANFVPAYNRACGARRLAVRSSTFFAAVMIAAGGGFCGVEAWAADVVPTGAPAAAAASAPKPCTDGSSFISTD
jgi:hypothetical protein